MRYLRKLDYSKVVIVGIILYTAIVVFAVTIPDSSIANPPNQELILKNKEIRALERIATSLERIERKLK